MGFIAGIRVHPPLIPLVKHVILSNPVDNHHPDPMQILANPRHFSMNSLMLETLTLVCDCAGTASFVDDLPRLNQILQERKTPRYCYVWKKLKPYVRRESAGKPPVVQMGRRPYVITGRAAFVEERYKCRRHYFYVTLTRLGS